MKRLQLINKHSNILFFFYIIFTGCFLVFKMPSFASEIDHVDITLFKHVEIEQEKIFLGNIAKIEGTNSILIRQLRNIFIGRSPLPGKSRRIDGNYINIRLKQNDIDFSRVRIRGPREIVVLRGFRIVTKEQIEKFVLDYIPHLTSSESDQVNIKNVIVRGDVLLPKGEFDYSIVPPKHKDFLGNVPLSVSFYVNGNYQKRVYVTVDVELIIDVVVARRPLRKHHKLTDIDIKTVRMDFADLPSNCITKPEDAVGKKLKRAVYTDTVLRSDLIELPPTVSRNDVVLMIAESDNFKITAFGESKEKGYTGDRIKVVNLDSKKTVYARIIDSNSVKVEF